MLGNDATEALRAEAIERFTVHIERWLQNTGQVLYGDGAIPQVSLIGEPRVSDADQPTPEAFVPDDEAKTAFG